jgi:hypothetical protein
MSAVLQHSIGRQLLECRVSAPSAQALDLQDRIFRLCREALPRVLESVLDRHVRPGDVLRIDTLSIDLGRIGLAGFEAEIEARLRAQLGETLRQALPEPSRQAQAGPVAGEGDALEAALVWFLRHGSLPGWCRIPAGASLAQAVQDHWHSLSGQLVAAAFAVQLREALRGGIAERRLKAQFDIGFRRALLERVSKGANAVLDETLLAMSGAGLPGPEGELQEGLLMAALMSAVEGAALDPATVVGVALDRLAPGSSLRPVLDGFAARRAARTQREIRLHERPQGRKSGSGGIDKPIALHELPDHPEQSTGLYVNHAGLVLLHPFLPRLFEALGISAGDKLLLPERALAMLHFLCTGARQAPEHELALAKVLCQLPLTWPADGSTVLTDAECAEAEALLKAAIGHWPALKNTTPDGLRGAFLLRPGKLLERAGEWHLRVQGDTADILMNSLPWGVGAVRLPWMAGILWVEWT